jgi:putative adenylate-forming enzyme
MRERLDILRHYGLARRRFTAFRDRESLRKWQDQMTDQHWQWVKAHSPYLKSLATDWRDLPIQNKQSWMQNFSGWNTAGIKLEIAASVAEAAERSRDFSSEIDGYTVGLSSGTSGSRGVFLASNAERRMWAGTLLARILPTTLWHRHRAALFLRANSRLYESIGSSRFQFSFFDLLEPLDSQMDRLRQLCPTVLAAPPSVLMALAKMQNPLEIIAPHGLIFSVAEVLSADDERFLERVFQRKVGQLYQATEGFLAATCVHGHLHWNEDSILLEKEYLDELKTRYYPILTDFRRRTQPIIRYRLNDIIHESIDKEICPCGSMFERIQQIEGREDEVLWLPSLANQSMQPVFPDVLRRSMILALFSDTDFIVHQDGLKHWVIRLSERGFEEFVRNEIQQLCHCLSLQMPEITFSEWMTPVPGAKRRRFHYKMLER